MTEKLGFTLAGLDCNKDSILLYVVENHSKPSLSWNRTSTNVFAWETVKIYWTTINMSQRQTDKMSFSLEAVPWPSHVSESLSCNACDSTRERFCPGNKWFRVSDSLFSNRFSRWKWGVFGEEASAPVKDMLSEAGASILLAVRLTETLLWCSVSNPCSKHCRFNRLSCWCSESILLAKESYIFL